MNIEPIYEELNLKSDAKKLFAETKIECNTGISTEDAVRILAVSSHATVGTEEILGDSLSCACRAIFCMVFRDSLGNLRKAECGTEFSNRLTVSDVAPNCKSKTTVTVRKVTIDTSGTNVILTAICALETEFTQTVSVKALSGGDGLIFRKCDKNTVREVTVKKATYPVEEEFELGYSVGEVLLHNANAVITASQCGVGSLICDGEIILSLSLLQKIQNSDILKETKVIPFRLETECLDAMPTCPATAFATVKSVKLDITVDETTGKSKVLAVINLEISGSFYEQTEKQLITDAYCPSCEITTDKKEVSYTVPQSEKVVDVKVNAKGVFTNSLDAGTRLMCCSNEKVTLTSVRAENTVINVEGVIESVAFCKDIESRIFSVPIEAPFKATLEVDIGENDYFVDSVIYELGARIISLEDFEFEGVIKFRVRTAKTENLCVLTGFEQGEEKKLNSSAISVYIPMAGEELWDVAKRLNTCPDVITALNGDLAFPLTGNERIVIYRQEKKEY